uniref:Uncharacterized protein n=1 Tax=Rhipicephalus zambeziensis TaxID=60191 RepID=A0A224YBE4_9ACAR
MKIIIKALKNSLRQAKCRCTRKKDDGPSVTGVPGVHICGHSFSTRTKAEFSRFTVYSRFRMYFCYIYTQKIFTCTTSLAVGNKGLTFFLKERRKLTAFRGFFILNVYRYFSSIPLKPGCTPNFAFMTNEEEFSFGVIRDTMKFQTRYI